jgi:hypothetical protein
MNLDDLKKLNTGLSDIDKISVGQRINIKKISEDNNKASTYEGSHPRNQPQGNGGDNGPNIGGPSGKPTEQQEGSSGTTGADNSKGNKPHFLNYKPEYLEQPLFAPLASKFSNYVNEPTWLYSGDMFDDPIGYWNYWDAKKKFTHLLTTCLSDKFCIDTVSSLVDKAVSRTYGFGLNQFNQKLKLSSDAFSIASSWVNTDRIITSSKQSSKLGLWTQPLRSELGYALSHVSPLVLDLNGDGIKLFPYSKGVYFDIDNDGFAERVGWVSPQDGQLARDLNGNGKIDDITELFGDDLISAYFKQPLVSDNKLSLAN